MLGDIVVSGLESRNSVSFLEIVEGIEPEWREDSPKLYPCRAYLFLKEKKIILVSGSAYYHPIKKRVSWFEYQAHRIQVYKSRIAEIRAKIDGGRDKVIQEKMLREEKSKEKRAKELLDFTNPQLDFEVIDVKSLKDIQHIAMQERISWRQPTDKNYHFPVTVAVQHKYKKITVKEYYNAGVILDYTIPWKTYTDTLKKESDKRKRNYRRKGLTIPKRIQRPIGCRIIEEKLKSRKKRLDAEKSRKEKRQELYDDRNF